MRIVVLDGFTLNPGDLSWVELGSLGPCVIHDRTAPEAIASRASAAEIVLTNKTVLDREIILRLPALRYIGVLATGFNVVDVEAARERELVVTNVPAYSTRSVAQLTFALLFELTLHVGHHSRVVREGKWARCPDFCFWDYPLVELDGLTMGVVGFGRIGQAVSELASALGMKALVHTCPAPTQRTIPTRLVDLESVFRDSDVVSLHCPLTPQTRHLVNAERLAWMKPTAFLLNTSRGPLVDEVALADALNTGRLAGAGVDVLSVEPPPATHPLLTARNCIITPHIAWATRAARGRLLQIAVDNVRAFLTGKPQNVVS
jgi:glycerate dehydrogenase